MNFRKINRGIVLGVVLVIGTSIYVVNDNRRFKQSEGDIKNVVDNYFDDIAELNLKKDEDVYSNVEELVDKTWGYGDFSNNDYNIISKSSIKSDLEYLKENSSSVGEVFTYETNITSLKINKYGPNGAVASFNLSEYIDFSGAPDILSYDSFCQVENNDYDQVSGEMNVDVNNEYSLTKEYYEAKIYLNYIDGEWKITGVANYGYSSNVNLINSNDNDSSSYDVDNEDDSSQGDESSKSDEDVKAGDDSEQ